MAECGSRFRHGDVSSPGWLRCGVGVFAVAISAFCRVCCAASVYMDRCVGMSSSNACVHALYCKQIQ